MPDKIQFLCSCPEYLSGTTKCSKKKSTCKKCKGIKLPLVPIGGTVRMLPPPIHNPINVQRYCSATVRLPSSSNGSRYTSNRRPTILSGDRDPYDFLRQSRLLYDEPQRNSDPINNNFLLNSSNRTSYFYDATPATSPMIIADGYRDAFMTATKLPYELISSTLHSNEFSPVYDVPSRKSIQNPSNGLKRVQSRKEERNIVGEKNLLKQKSILKQSIVPLTPIGLNGLYQDGIQTCQTNTNFSYATRAKTTSESNEKRNQSTTNGMSNNVKQSTISGIRSSKSFCSKNPVTKTQATLTARNKKVQFTETNSESEKESEHGQNNQNNYDDDVQILENAHFIRSRKKGNLRRSMSDRRLSDDKQKINFKDTTALRPKPVRPRIIQRQSMPMRPSSPPPQLPTSAMKPRSTSVPVRPPRRGGAKKLSDASRDSEIESTSRIFGLLPVSTLNKSTTSGKTESIETPPIQKTLIAVNSEEATSTVEVRDKQQSYRSSVLIAGDNSNEVITSNSSANQLNGHQSTAVDRSSNGVFVIKTIAESAANGSATEIKIVYNENIEKNCANSSSIPSNCGKTTTLICVGGNDDPVKKCDVKKSTENLSIEKKKCSTKCDSLSKSFGDGFILKLLSDHKLNQLMQGLEIKEIASVIEKSLLKLKNSQQTKPTKDYKLNETVKSALYDIIRDELKHVEKQKQEIEQKIKTRPRAKSPEDNETETIPIRQLYEMLSSSPVWKSNDSNHSNNSDHDHQYESICMNCDPIYEEINDVPPPLPANPPPTAEELKGKSYKPMFLGASKYDILSYLVDAKERGVLPEESYSFKFLKSQHSTESAKVITIIRDPYIDSKTNYSSGSDDIPMKLSSLSNGQNSIGKNYRKFMATIERNDSGVGSETSKISRNKYRSPTLPSLSSIDNGNLSSIQLCEDCDDSVETSAFDQSTVMFESIICRKCMKKRAERREILAEFFETEEKYSRDLQIIIDEFYQPMLVAGLLTQEQLSAVFLNIEDLLENSQSFCEKLRETFYSALEQNDDDLFTVDIGKILLQLTPMLNAFEEYCTQQAAASLLLANLEKEKELLRIFLRVSQMENAVLRRMNLNSFLMVPVQRVTKYPLLLSRLYKVTPTHLESRERLKDAQEMIESHLNRMNREAKDISTKLWRRLASNQSIQTTRENDIHNIKLRKIVVDLLEWNHEKVYFVVEGKLLVTQPTDNNWRKGRTIKLTPVNALLVTNETIGSTKNHNENNQINFHKPSKTREVALVLVREKSGRYSLFRDPMYLDKCVICTESEWAEYFEVHEISTKDSFIFKAEDDSRTKYWYSQIQHCAQGTGTWRKRRTALANIMINGMMHRS